MAQKGKRRITDPIMTAALLNKNQVAALVDDDDEAQQTVLQYLIHQKPEGELTVDNVTQALAKQGKHVGYYDVVYTFRTMEDAGMGRFLVGRRGGVSRFQWGQGKVVRAAKTVHAATKRHDQPETVTISVTVPANSPLVEALRGLALQIST